MYQALSKEIATNTTQYQILQDNQLLSYATIIESWKQDEAFIDFFVDILRECPYEAFFWEVKPIIADKLHTSFEFVLVNSTTLPSIRANANAFQSYFSSGKLVVSFPNLGKDAMLIVPTKQGSDNYYNHLASFIRNAPKEQIRSFWKCVGTEYGKAIGTQTKWLSTAGLGVYWLHVRVDSRPKYYRYQPYKKA